MNCSGTHLDKIDSLVRILPMNMVRMACFVLGAACFLSIGCASSSRYGEKVKVKVGDVVAEHLGANGYYYSFFLQDKDSNPNMRLCITYRLTGSNLSQNTCKGVPPLNTTVDSSGNHFSGTNAVSATQIYQQVLNQALARHMREGKPLGTEGDDSMMILDITKELKHESPPLR